LSATIRLPSRSPPVPYTTLFRSSLAVGVGPAEADDGEKAEHQAEAPPAETPQGERPREEKDGQRIEEDEDEGDQVEADGELHPRSEEHTSELQSRENLVCRLLLE